MEDKEGSGELWYRVLRSALRLPGARLDRDRFLRKELGHYFEEDQVEEAIRTTPAKTRIPKRIIDKIGRDCIAGQTVRATAFSFGAGLPGGWWMTAATVADLTQFYWHAILLVQKLAYLYGWPELFDDDSDIDDETLLRFSIFTGVMLGTKGAAKAVESLAEKVSMEIAVNLPQKALTRSALYNISRQVAKWIGVRLSKDSFSRALSKVIPIIGGFISSGISWISMRTMGINLQRHLSRLPPADA